MAYDKADPSPRDPERGESQSARAPRARTSSSPSIGGGNPVNFLRRSLSMASSTLEDEPDVNDLEADFRAELDAEVMTRRDGVYVGCW